MLCVLGASSADCEESSVPDLSAQHASDEGLASSLRAVLAEVERRGLEADVYGQGSAVQEFEKKVATLLGKEAACFFTTGSLAQLSALRAYVAAANREDACVAVHPTSHIVHHDCLRNWKEQEADFNLHAQCNAGDLKMVAFGGANSAPTVAEFEDVLKKANPAVVVLELPQRMCGGRTVPFKDLVQMRELAEKAGVAMHMDGARLWEVMPYYDCPFHELCNLFDSVYVSFYKGLGAMSGAMLCGKADLLQRCRALQTAHGGTPMSVTVEVVHAELMLEAQLQSFATRYARLCELVAAIGKVEGLEGLLRFDPPVPQSCMIHGYLVGQPSQLEEAHGRVVAGGGCRLWNRFRGCGHGPETGAYFEWSMGPANSAVETALAVDSWRALAKEMQHH